MNNAHQEVIVFDDGQYQLVRDAVGSRCVWWLMRGRLCRGVVQQPTRGDNWRVELTNSGRITSYTGDADECIGWLWANRYGVPSNEVQF